MVKPRHSRKLDSHESDSLTPVYEDRLSSDLRWAMEEGSRHFEGDSNVHRAMRRICKRLGELGIDYAVSGAMALFAHNYRRTTDDVDILVTREDLKRIHRELSGRGYVPPFTGSKNLRDTEAGVKVEFLIAGDYPGDGKPKPVAFPQPSDASIERDGIRFLNLVKLVELKLASGMTQPARRRDLADVQELIKLLNLSVDFADQLDPYVRTVFHQLWSEVREVPTRYVLLWRNKFLTVGANSIEEMAARLKEAVAMLEAMRADGVTLDPDRGTADDYAYLVTTDPEVAKKYGMHDEREFLGDDVDVGA